MNSLFRPLTLLFCLFCLQVGNATAATVQQFGLTDNDAFLLVNESGEVVYEWQADKSMIPASTLKLLTASLALQRWGDEHRFQTDFYWYQEQLWVKGYGDPFITSEELDLIASELNKLPLSIKTIAIDGSFFQLKAMPEVSSSNDPYNAPVSAVAANFNTVFIKKNGANVQSAEPQTPLTPLAKQLALSLGDGKQRIHVQTKQNAELNFAQLLRAKLVEENAVDVVVGETVPENAELIYRHYSSHSLAETLKGALTYSNNFIANQIFLMLAAQEASKEGAVTLQKALQNIYETIQKNYQWKSFSIVDGSGLARENRLSAKQLNEVLAQFSEHKGLLKKYDVIDGVTARAKTGTLNGIRTFAGYLLNSEEEYQFVLFYNRPTAYGQRQKTLKKVASFLADK